MNGKVTVTKEVAEALAETERNFITIGATLRVHAVNGLTDKYAPLQTLNIEDLAKALINGYEVEKTPEEKVREYYTTLKLREEYSSFIGIQHRQGWLSVEETLNLLGIKIEGVNG